MTSSQAKPLASGLRLPQAQAKPSRAKTRLEWAWLELGLAWLVENPAQRGRAPAKSIDTPIQTSYYPQPQRGRTLTKSIDTPIHTSYSPRPQRGHAPAKSIAIPGPKGPRPS